MKKLLLLYSSAILVSVGEEAKKPDRPAPPDQVQLLLLISSSRSGLDGELQPAPNAGANSL